MKRKTPSKFEQASRKDTFKAAPQKKFVYG